MVLTIDVRIHVLCCFEEATALEFVFGLEKILEILKKYQK
jgi:hypothetical protein